MAKNPVNWNKYGVIVSIIGIVLATAISIWSLSRPAPGSVTNIQALFQTINNYFNAKDADTPVTEQVHNSSASQTESSSSVSIATKADTASTPTPGTSSITSSSQNPLTPDNSPRFVSLRPLAQDSPVDLSSSPVATTTNLEGYLNILMKVTPKKLPQKIFTSDFRQNWSLSTDRGASCDVVKIDGIQDYNRYDNYKAHIETMPVVLVGTPLVFNVTAICKQKIYNNTKIYLTAQLSILPDVPVDSVATSEIKPIVINFTSDALSVQ